MENDNDVDKLIKLANNISKGKDCDIILFNDDISWETWRTFYNQSKAREGKQKNAILILITGGGDAAAAYRIARHVQKNWDHFSLHVVGPCKSAGTLVATGANELVFYETGELGPLDVQMTKRDELWESQSGLTVQAALITLHDKTLSAFDHFMLSMKRNSGGAITFPTAADIAAKLVKAIYEPIYKQIDPAHVGEAGRAVAIAIDYGRRLADKSGNIESHNLMRLVAEYPDHGFVIDQDEATELFKRVRSVDDDESVLILSLEENGMINPGSNLICFLNQKTKKEQDSKENMDETLSSHEGLTPGDEGYQVEKGDGTRRTNADAGVGVPGNGGESSEGKENQKHE